MSTTHKTAEFTDILGDVFDIRDVIARFEELDAECDDTDGDSEQRAEHGSIESFLNEVRGCGGDEQWRGNWYPVTFIADSYFTEYAEELVSDIGDMPRKIPSYIVIDWEATARNIQQDYSSVEIDGATYWYR